MEPDDFDKLAAAFFPAEQLSFMEGMGDEVESQLEAERCVDSSRNPEFTLAGVMKHKPVEFKMAVYLRVQRISLREVVRLTGLSPNTVLAIDHRLDSHHDVETIRQALAGRARAAGRLALERIEEYLAEAKSKDLDPGKLANLLKVLVEKSELLEGRATARVENITPDEAEPTDYDKLLAEAGVINVTPEMGPAAGKSEAHEADPERPGLPPASPSPDGESDV